MNPPGNDPLFWTTLAFTIGGALLALGATAVLASRAVRSRRDLRARYEGGQAASAATVKRSQERDALRLARKEFDGEANMAAVAAEQARFEREFEAVVGRPTNSVNFADNLLMPELIELAITEDQIDELKLPAVLVALGVVTSTIGSVLSLWV